MCPALCKALLRLASLEGDAEMDCERFIIDQHLWGEGGPGGSRIGQREWLSHDTSGALAGPVGESEPALADTQSTEPLSRERARAQVAGLRV